MLLLVVVSTVGHFQGDHNFFLVCAACASTYLVGILQMIKITIMKAKGDRGGTVVKVLCYK